MKKATVIGGGTGTFVVLSGLKQLSVDLAAVVSMMDSGGSTGRLRDQLGVLPPGDVRQCLVALSEATDLWRKLFVYRFDQGDLKGHTFGNLFLSALEKVSSNYDEVMETAEYVLKTKGKVYPVTYEKTHLCVEYANGTVVKGEGNIDENNHEHSAIAKAYLEPDVSANQKAVDRIMDSDIIIVGPGDLYTSIIPVFLVSGVVHAIQQSSAKVVYIMNLMTKSGQTSTYTAKQHVKDLTQYMGRSPDIVLYNTAPIPPDALAWYEKQNEQLVINDLQGDGFSGTVIDEDLLDTTLQIKNGADTLTRSIIRHDSQKIARVLQPLLI